MIKGWFLQYRNGLIAAVVIAVYLKFLLLPTAEVFFSAYHTTKLEVLYVGYQIFKAAGYYMSIWDHQNLAALMSGFVVFLCYGLLKRRRMNTSGSREAGQNEAS